MKKYSISATMALLLTFACLRANAALSKADEFIRLNSGDRQATRNDFARLSQSLRDVEHQSSDSRGDKFVIAGTSSGSGGGSGRACFDSSVETSRLKKGLHLEDYEKIESLVTGEYWENSKLAFFSVPRDGETTDTFVDRMIHEKLDDTLPFFAERLRESLRRLNGHTWLWNSPLPRLQDEGYPELPLDSGTNCETVQLAIRIKHAPSSSAGNWPDVELVLDKHLIEKIVEKNNPKQAILNLGLLKLHEALYLLSTELNFSTSRSSRKLSTILMSQRATDLTKAASPNERYIGWLQILSMIGYESYMTLFTGTIDTNQKPSPGTKLSRQISLARLTKRLRAVHPSGLELIANMQIPGFDRTPAQNFNWFLYQALGEMEGADVSSEEAFLLSASLHASVGDGPGPDYFAAQSTDDRAALQKQCEQDSKSNGGRSPFKAAKGFSQTDGSVELAKLRRKSASYCQLTTP